jgi:hypothetical protein
MSRDLQTLVKPETLAYFFHVLHKHGRCTAEDAREFRDHLEQSIVRTTTNDPSYFKDVAMVWACLGPALPSSAEAGKTMMSATEKTTNLVISDSGCLADLGSDIQNGRCTIQCLSVLKYALCQKWARPLLATTLHQPDSCVTKVHIDALTKLMVRYAVDCTFKTTGDWMINAKTRLLCPSWMTCITAGGDAPYTVATEIHGPALNDMLKPTIRTPIVAQVRTALDGNEGVDSFLALCAVFGELVPQSRVAINTDVLSIPGLNEPTPFYISNCVLPGVFTKDAYGIMLNEHVRVFNGRSIAAALCQCLHAMKIVGTPQARDAAEYVFSHEAVSDSNPYAKYV